jgi:hypothetical protein
MEQTAPRKTEAKNQVIDFPVVPTKTGEKE